MVDVAQEKKQQTILELSGEVCGDLQQISRRMDNMVCRNLPDTTKDERPQFPNLLDEIIDMLVDCRSETRYIASTFIECIEQKVS